MRNRITEGQNAVLLQPGILDSLVETGYKYVQIKGLTADGRYDYYSPDFMLLVPLKELPADPKQKGIYEPIPSILLAQWANMPDEEFKILVEQY